MSAYRLLSPRALEYLFEIWEYIAEHDEPIADAFIAKVFHTIGPH